MSAPIAGLTLEEIEAWNAAVEECAKVAEFVACNPPNHYDKDWPQACRGVARAIRSLARPSQAAVARKADALPRHRPMYAADIGLIAGNIAEVAPHAAYCDIALQDCQFAAVDEHGDTLWSFDDDLFDASLAGNGWKVVPVDIAGAIASAVYLNIAWKGTRAEAERVVRAAMEAR